MHRPTLCLDLDATCRGPQGEQFAKFKKLVVRHRLAFQANYGRHERCLLQTYLKAILRYASRTSSDEAVLLTPNVPHGHPSPPFPDIAILHINTSRDQLSLLHKVLVQVLRQQKRHSKQEKTCRRSGTAICPVPPGICTI